VKVIAEVKRRSPSRGEINADLDPASRARGYEQGGAAAISVLTEPQHFSGSEQDLVDVHASVRVPLLRKDFIIDELQIIEARAWGASAVLLIARALPTTDLIALADTARRWGVEPLVEIRTVQELDVALGARARVIGVNSRDLETLEVDATAVDRLLPQVPASIVAIAESGMRSVADVERAARAGADAVLVGSALSASPDPAAAVRALAAVDRVGR
jgi:indole-3-glycerol phosphate synthase